MVSLYSFVLTDRFVLISLLNFPPCDRCETDLDSLNTVDRLIRMEQESPMVYANTVGSYHQPQQQQQQQ